ncbi:glycoside hydrolase family 16 protein [Stenotrophomonas tumulicola]|uniref:Glycoside hydrolase family 16 protein n=1 Tax=Stenotrophomonas tumulicola TaxID=1685415 RepID=A0A7W3FJY4_9GAMM|nr:glycoside hydrolase family 16 protein [Stenotrophomonas tumulicola]MBA8680951.1 glycoside hydrolase family 16 protein [Stenotrophomonas tumulicola]
MMALPLLAGLLLPGGAGAGMGVSQASGWELVWQDEFDGAVIDASKWELEDNCWGGGNNEQQCYTARRDAQPGANAYLADGLLHIVARSGQWTGPASPGGDGEATATLPFTSARLRTRHRQEWTFGRFEVRAKLPAGQGTWPAIWMLPTDSPHGRWAASGEIDIMEAVNLGTPSDAPGAAPGQAETRVHGTLHFGRPPPGNRHAGSWYALPEGKSPADDFHVYALEWEAGAIRWYVDGVHYATRHAGQWYSQRDDGQGNWVDAPQGAPFDAASRFHLLLNVAVGGDWAGKANAGGIDASAFPQAMQVDYVRVFRCTAGQADGSGCATRGARPSRDVRMPTP